jgi:hypothetical protein
MFKLNPPGLFACPARNKEYVTSYFKSRPKKTLLTMICTMEEKKKTVPLVIQELAHY